MSQPSVTFIIEANALGQSPPGLGLVTVVMGVSSAGTVNQPLSSPVPQVFVDNFGFGPGPQLAALIAQRSGNPVTFVKVNATTLGSNTAVRNGGSNTSTSVVSVSGAPFDDGYWLVKVVTGGTIGTSAVIQVSPDYGRTFTTVNLGTANSYAIPNTGITLNFGAGTLVVDDTFAFNSTAPHWADVDVQAAIASLYGQTSFYPLDIFITGSAQEADGVAIDGYITSLSTKKIFTNAILESVDVTWGGLSNQTEAAWMTAIEAAWAPFVSTNGQIGVTAGYYNEVSPIDGGEYRRPLSWFAAVRDASVAISEDWGFVERGPLAPIVQPTSPDGFVYHDESVLSGLDGARFITATSIQTLPGLYITNPNMMCAPSSDFNWVQHRHVINKFMQILYNFFVQKLNGSIRVSKSTGYILPQDANTLENGCDAALAAGIVNTGDCSAADITVTRNNNILSTNQLEVTGKVVPLAYAKQIQITVGFNNPAVSQV